MERPILYMLVGLPGSGKTTWLANQKDIHNYIILSTDKYIEMTAKCLDKTYNDVFFKCIKKPRKFLNKNCNMQSKTIRILFGIKQI